MIKLICATRNRLAKLYRMLDSLAAASGAEKVEPLIIFDGDAVNFKRFAATRGSSIEALLVKEHSGNTYCRNFAMKFFSDADVLYAVDDITFKAKSIEQAARDLKERFAGDGVVGFSQLGNKFHPSGIALIGSAFVDRYPDRQLFYPGYYHFAAQEIYDHANKIGRFFLSKASIYHFHPDHHREEIDQTHREARRYKARDFLIRAERAKSGLIWGLSG